MEKDVFEGAISASPNIVTRHLNPDARLEAITSVVVIYLPTMTYDIYRKSSTPKLWSLETVNILTKEKTKATGNDKHDFPPILDNNRPISSFIVGGVTCSAYVDVIQNEQHKTSIMGVLKDVFNLE